MVYLNSNKSRSVRLSYQQPWSATLDKTHIWIHEKWNGRWTILLYLLCSYPCCQVCRPSFKGAIKWHHHGDMKGFTQILTMSADKTKLHRVPCIFTFLLVQYSLMIAVFMHVPHTPTMTRNIEETRNTWEGESDMEWHGMGAFLPSQVGQDALWTGADHHRY